MQTIRKVVAFLGCLRRGRCLSMSFAMTGSFMLLMSAAVGVALFFSYSNSFETTLQLLRDKTVSSVERVQERTSLHLSPAMDQVKALGELVQMGELDTRNAAQLEVTLRAMLASTSQLQTAIYVDKDLQATWVNRSESGYDVSQEDWRKNAERRHLMKSAQRQTQPYWSEFFYVPEIDVTVISASMPVHVNGTFQGVFIVTVKLEQLSDFLKQLHIQDRGTAFILSGREWVIAHPRFTEVRHELNEYKMLLPLQDLGDPVINSIWRDDAEQMGEANDPFLANGGAVRVKADGRRYFAVYQWTYGYDSVPWIVGVYFEWDEIVDEIRQLSKALAASVLVLMASLWLSWKLGKHLTRPVHRLSQAARDLELHRPEQVAKLPRSMIAEMDDASVAFNRMLDGLSSRERMRRTFGKFVPRSIVDAVLADQGTLKPVTCEATVLFSDIAGFSTFAERMQPEEIIHLLNEYFSLVIEPIESRGGVIHQFQGDAVLATFNLPIEDANHAQNAVAAALEIGQLLQEKVFCHGKQIETRIGLNTGVIVGGTVGGEGRLGYTVHGDAVNLAARVEQLNKQFGSQLLVTESTFEKISRTFNATFVDTLKVRGRWQPVKLYRIDITPFEASGAASSSEGDGK